MLMVFKIWRLVYSMEVMLRNWQLVGARVNELEGAAVAVHIGPVRGMLAKIN